jgi:hypothetical protein
MGSLSKSALSGPAAQAVLPAPQSPVVLDLYQKDGKTDPMKKLLKSGVAVAVGTLAAGVLSLALAGTASASGPPPWEPDGNSVGGLIFYNAAGQQITGGNITTTPLAAYAQGTATIRAGDTTATLYGYLPVDGQSPGQWSGEALSGSTTFPNAAAPGAIGTSPLPLVTGASGDETVAQLTQDFPNTDTSSDGYAGMYVLRLKTSGPGLQQTGTYDSVDIQVTGTETGGIWSSGTWSVVYPVPSLTTTSTGLTASPTSPQTAGTSVTLKATITPAAPGTVQFEVGTTPIGSPVTVAGGTASIATTTLPVGTDSLSAIYTPAQFSAYSGSTGDASYTITPPPAAATTTALAVDPGTGPALTSVSITATVTNNVTSADVPAGSGSVAFYDDGATDSSGDITSNSILLGTEAIGSGGQAVLSYGEFAQGTHYIAAEFVPTVVSPPVLDSSEAAGGSSYVASAPLYAPASQTVDVTIPAGTITITTPYSSTNPFELGTAALNADQTAFVASAPFGSSSNPQDGVTITDTQAGDQSWTASATAGNFTDNNADIINAQNLTFTSVTPSYIVGNALQTGDVVTNDITNTAVYPPGASGHDGLAGGPHQFATAANGDGSVYIYGQLTLTAPTSTPANTYTATLTFTII